MPQAIINTIHAMINKIHTIIIYPMLLLTIWCYYQPTHAIISKTHPIIRHLIFRHLNNSYVIIKHIMLLSNSLCYYQTPMLLSNNSRYYQTPHIIINTSTHYSYTLYHTIIIITTGHPIFMICHYIINHIILLSDTYVIIKHLILLSTLQPINLKLHTIL